MKLFTAATILSVVFSATAFAGDGTPDNFSRAKQAVIRILKDPDSAKFGNLFEGSGRSGKKAICGFINAKNGFGGYTGMTQFIYFINEDEAYTPSYPLIIADAWNAECTDAQGRRRFQ